MSVLRRGEDYADWVLTQNRSCAHCNSGGDRWDIAKDPGPFVYWMGIKVGNGGYDSSVDLVFHPTCALEFAAHLTADAIAARIERNEGHARE